VSAPADTRLPTQFLGEAVVMAAVALVFAMALVEILLRPMTASWAADCTELSGRLAAAADHRRHRRAGGLAQRHLSRAGAVGLPSSHGATQQPAGPGGLGGLRTALGGLQFAVSIALAIATLVVFAQIDFARNQVLGFRHDNTVVIQTNNRMTPDTRESFISTLRAYPGVSGVAASRRYAFLDNSISPMLSCRASPAR